MKSTFEEELKGKRIRSHLLKDYSACSIEYDCLLKVDVLKAVDKTLKEAEEEIKKLSTCLCRDNNNSSCYRIIGEDKAKEIYRRKFGRIVAR